MFYSHTFLARKGPLGTVWCAAHLQHRLKKSHYTATHIPSTVEQIMFPEVPIALRMSGHLLLGVVRIYSKKIDYLFQDYNGLLSGIREAFNSSTDVNLPKDATQAKFDDVTLPLPSKFSLDEFDVVYNPEGFHDNHSKSIEDITLPDHITSGRDHDIAINISEGDSIQFEDAPGSVPVPIEEDSPSMPIDATAGFHNPGPSNQTGVNERINEDSNPENSPESAHLLDAVPSKVTDDRPFPPNGGDDIVEPDTVVVEIIKEKDKNIQVVDEIVVSGGKPNPQHENQEQQSTPSEQDPNNNDSPVAFAHVSPNFGMQPSPTREQPRPRRRKRLFDEKTVLTNKFMKKAIEDSSDLMRKRKDWCSSLGVWRLNNKQKQEKVFLEPSITGLSNELCKIFNNDYISAKYHLVRIEEAHPGPNVAEPPSPVNDVDDMETDVFRYVEGPPETNNIISTPTGRDDITPATSNGLGSHSDQELSFLEEDYRPAGARGTPETDYSSGNQRGTPETDSLSVSARAVAQYLLKKSPVTPTSGEHEDLSLNTILEGKRRKICARMFFETLVLKNCGLIDIKQDETYGDIRLKVTPKLSKELFSS